MSITVTKTNKLVRTVIIDVVLLAAICIIPAMSHILSFPIYKLNPMLLFLLLGTALVSDRRNAYLLAVALPLVSMAVSGMPTPAKAACMVPELVAVVALYQLLSRRMPVAVAMFVSIIAGKLVFYALMAVVVAPEHLIGTAIWLQLAVALIYAAFFATTVRLKNR
ncbi:MAG: hypothetical protein J6X86_04740 [Bacteroidales bacterium]|nr:hypothetical protein [Bacteroidales bacterium]